MLAAFGACAAAPASGQETPASQSSSPDAVGAVASSSAAGSAFESTRRAVRSTTEWLARGVDGWFGDKPFSDGGKVTDGEIGLSVLDRQHESPDVTLRFNARMRLPNIEEHTYLFLGRDDRREVVTDTPEALSRQQLLLRDNAADRSFFAGLGFPLLSEVLQARVGLRGGLKPYAQVRYDKPWQLGVDDGLDVRETLFWTLDDHLGSTTAVSVEHTFTPSLTGRWLSAATITQSSKVFEWTSAVGAYKSFGDQRLLSLEALFGGLQGLGVAVPDRGLQVKWAQPVHADWVIGEILVGRFWSRGDVPSEHVRAWGAGLGVRMMF